MKKICALLLILLLCFSCGCAPNAAQRLELFAMDTVMTLSAYGPYAREALRQSAEIIMNLEEKFTASKETGEIAMLNANAGSTIEVSEDTARILTAARDYCVLTGGALDVTTYPLLEAWGFISKNYTVPDRKTLQSLCKHVGVNQLKVDRNSVTLSPGTAVGLGAIAKGYASDRVVEQLQACKINSAVISLGGNVYVLGTKPDGTLWRVGIAHPNDPSLTAATVEICNKAVVTSGGYQRFFEKDGIVYQHILNPKTGNPVTGNLSSVTIVSSSGTQADALSTALYVMGEEQAIEFWREHRDFELILMTKDNRVLVTPGLANSFTLIDDGYTYSIIS